MTNVLELAKPYKLTSAGLVLLAKAFKFETISVFPLLPRINTDSGI